MPPGNRSYSPLLTQRHHDWGPSGCLLSHEQTALSLSVTHPQVPAGGGSWVGCLPWVSKDMALLGPSFRSRRYKCPVDLWTTTLDNPRVLPAAVHSSRPAFTISFTHLS